MEQDVRELIFALHRHDGTAPISKLPGLWNRKLNQHSAKRPLPILELANKT